MAEINLMSVNVLSDGDELTNSCALTRDTPCLFRSSETGEQGGTLWP